MMRAARLSSSPRQQGQRGIEEINFPVVDELCVVIIIYYYNITCFIVKDNKP